MMDEQQRIARKLVILVLKNYDISAAYDAAGKPCGDSLPDEVDWFAEDLNRLKGPPAPIEYVLPEQQHSPGELKYALELFERHYADGITLQALADEYGISKQAIHQAIARGAVLAARELRQQALC